MGAARYPVDTSVTVVLRLLSPLGCLQKNRLPGLNRYKEEIGGAGFAGSGLTM